MKKSKHFRKDVILARIIAGVILLVLIVLLTLGISMLKKPSEEDKSSQNSQNSEYTEDLTPGGQDTQEGETEEESAGDIQQTETTETEDTEQESEESKAYVKTTAQLKLREEPTTKSTVLAYIPAGTKLEVISPLENWYKVTYNGKTGYVSAGYVEVVK